MKRTLAVLALTSACGSAGDPDVARYAEAWQTRDAAKARVEARAAAQPAAPSPSASAAGAAPSSAPSSSPSTPLPTRPAILLSGAMAAPLFTDELARIRIAVTKKLDENEVLPVRALSTERVAALAAIAKSGKLRADGPTCAAPPSTADVVHAAHPELVVARWSLQCLGDRCGAQIEARAERYRTHGDAGWSEPQLLLLPSVQDPSSVADWEAAIAAEPARKPDGRLGGGGLVVGVGGVGTADGAVHVQRIDAFHFEAKPAAADFAREEKVASACGEKVSLATALLAVGRDGRVTRCEEKDAKSGCYCAAFSRHVFDAATADRRLRLHFSHAVRGGAAPVGGGVAPRVGGKPAAVRVTQSGVTFDETFEMRAPREAALEKCFSPGHSFEFDLRSKLDPSGAVSSVQVSKGADLMSTGETTCVELAAKKFVYRCPDQPGDEVWGRFSVY